ncbi:MAG: ethylbenzene dehydrogenase-related protein [Wenzhouxiangellaceae bacterium]|nr:ethylbenzene dehydrogenase-related protein [Wenzhouxiangellaceae bacterium]
MTKRFGKTLGWLTLGLALSPVVSAQGMQLDTDFFLVQGQWVEAELVEGNNQGITLDFISTADQVFLTWYTFQDQPVAPAFGIVGSPDQRWLSGHLDVTGPNVVSGKVYSTSGGQFNMPNTGNHETREVGTMTIEFLGCDLANVTYQLDSGPSGEFAIMPLEKRAQGDLFECESREPGADDAAARFNVLAISDPAVISIAEEALDLTFGPWTNATSFYPNQASYEWIGGRNVARTAPLSGHFGGEVLSNGPACVECHQNYVPETLSPPDVGETVDPGFDKPRSLDFQARAAYTAQRLFLQLRYTSNTDALGRFANAKQPGPAITHQTYRFDGVEFRDRGIPKESGPDGTLSATYSTLGNRRFNYEDRVAAMMVPAALDLTDPNGARFNRAGCFVACHDDLRNMPSAEEAESMVGADPILGDAGLGESDIRHYILNSRSGVNALDQLFTFSFDATSLSDYVSDELLPALEAGEFIDLWQARVARSVPMGFATDDYIAHYRRGNNAEVSGTNGFATAGDDTFFSQNPDPDRGNLMPYIYDPEVTGFWAIPESQLAAFMRGDFLKKRGGPMISEGPEKNVINLENDGIFAWNEAAGDYELMVNHGGEAAGTFLKDILNPGDLIPRRVLVQPNGARSALMVLASWEESGQYYVTFVRDLSSAFEGQKTTSHDIDLQDGMTIGFGIFDDNSSNRSHYVTFPLGLVAQGNVQQFLMQPGVHPDTIVIQAAEN